VADLSEIVVTNEIVDVESLTVDPRNARSHSESQIAQIAQSIQQFGYAASIVVQPSRQIIGGHATVAALKRLGRKVIDVRMVHGLTAAKYRKLGLALNKIPENSRWDDAILRELMGEMDAAGEDLSDIGFSSNELTKLLAEVDDIEVKEIETSTVEDECWISIRAPLMQQANILKALGAALAPFEGVNIEQGTIAIG
jgi:ParB-like chromosome segregation protein Spo0J